MAFNLGKQVFINLPVKDLKKTIKFFTEVGFNFDPRFTDKNATCMIIGENMYVMLLTKKFFKTFTKKTIVNATKSAEVINAIAVHNKNEVDEIMSKVLLAGGTEVPREQMNLDWMYGRAFEDIDGHIWEIFFMDENLMPIDMKEKK